MALIVPLFLPVSTTTTTQVSCFPTLSQSSWVQGGAGLWSVGTLRQTAGRHRHSTANAMGGALQWQSSQVNDYIFGGYTDVSWSGGRHIKFVKRGQDNFIGSTIVPLGMGGGEMVLEEIWKDAPLRRAPILYYFILIVWPSRYLHTYIVCRNVSYLITLIGTRF